MNNWWKGYSNTFLGGALKLDIFKNNKGTLYAELIDKVFRFWGALDSVIILFLKMST